MSNSKNHCVFSDIVAMSETIDNTISQPRNSELQENWTDDSLFSDIAAVAESTENFVSESQENWTVFEEYSTPPVETSTEVFVCTECLLVFTSVDQYCDHMAQQHEQVTFRCPLCTTFTLSLEERRSHIKKNHPSLQCPYCDYTDHDENKVIKHMSLKHLMPKNLKCDDGCSFTTNHINHLRTHKKFVHQNVRFACGADGCKYIADSKGHLKYHRRTVHAKILLKCDLCDFRTKYKSSLPKHVRRRH
mgnify:CR=1 FL=1